MSNNFGVIEVASARTTNAPGWAYVPDVSVHAAAAAAASSASGPGRGGGGRKRAARALPNASVSDLSARQATAVRRKLEALDRDGQKDANIAVPQRPGAGAGGVRTQNKHTPNVRKILMSQKTFANHLDDYVAMQALHDNNNSPHPASAPASASRRPAAAAAAAAAQQTSSSSAAASKKKKPAPAPAPEPDHPMPDADAEAPPTTTTSSSSDNNNHTLLAPYSGGAGALPAPTTPDADPLLASRVPPLPTDDELRALLAAPPLAYGEARGDWAGSEAARYPGRAFCEVCGYWGRVACLKCGTRVCALECLDVHRAECFTRYGI